MRLPAWSQVGHVRRGSPPVTLRILDPSPLSSYRIQMAGRPLTSLFAILIIRSGPLSGALFQGAPAVEDSTAPQEHAVVAATLTPLPRLEDGAVPSSANVVSEFSVHALPPPPPLGEPSMEAAPPDTTATRSNSRNAAPETAAGSEPRAAATQAGVFHVVMPGESIQDIAARYGVATQLLLTVNRISPELPKVDAGRRIWVPKGRRELAAQPLLIRIRVGETWASVAHQLQLNESALRDWNPGLQRALKDGDTLRCWLEREELHALRARRFSRGEVILTAAATPHEASPQVNEPEHQQTYREEIASANNDLALVAKRRRGSESVGRTNRGRLVRGVSLRDDDPAFLLVRPSEAWATDYVAKSLVSALHRFQRISRYRRPIAIASISQQRGGKLKPHRSHQSGRDADIRLPARDKDRPLAYKPNHRGEIDWDVAWMLVRSLLKTERVKYVFLERSGQRMLYRAARRAGLTDRQAAQWFQYSPSGDRRKTIIRHADGHIGHIHVRFLCAPHDTRCEER